MLAPGRGNIFRYGGCAALMGCFFTTNSFLTSLLAPEGVGSYIFMYTECAALMGLFFLFLQEVPKHELSFLQKYL